MCRWVRLSVHECDYLPLINCAREWAAVRRAVTFRVWRASQSLPVRVRKRFSDVWTSFFSLTCTGLRSMNRLRFSAVIAGLVRWPQLLACISSPRSRGLRPVSPDWRSMMVIARIS
jgi:hypothetical protein